jgi:hypothetical protein
LLIDLYELNMAASYLRRSMTGQATFSLFVRRLPPGRGFVVPAGLADCLRRRLRRRSFPGAPRRVRGRPSGSRVLRIALRATALRAAPVLSRLMLDPFGFV